jgi:hypothetical protein
LNQVLYPPSRIEFQHVRRLEGFFIRPIELKSKGQGTSAFVIVISKASAHAPHQSDDKLYHKRHDATKLVMDDYENPRHGAAEHRIWDEVWCRVGAID